MRKEKVYEFYLHGPGSRPTRDTHKYRSGMWIVRVRAVSLKEANIFLNAALHNPNYLCEEIEFVDNSVGPNAGWPWPKMWDRVYPSWWKRPIVRDGRYGACACLKCNPRVNLIKASGFVTAADVMKEPVE
jgi:hypothetical protein